MSNRHSAKPLAGTIYYKVVLLGTTSANWKRVGLINGTFSAGTSCSARSGLKSYRGESMVCYVKIIFISLHI